MGTSRAAVAEKQFIVDAPQQRVWKVLGGAIFQCLPLEQMNILDQTTFYALLRWKLGFISIPLNIKGKIVDVIPPNSLGSIIWVKKAILQLGIKVEFTLRAVNGDKTEVLCSAMEEEGGRSLLGRLMRGQQRGFAQNIFDSIEARLKQLC